MNPLLLLFESDKRKDKTLIAKRERDFKCKVDLINKKNFEIMSYWSNIFKELNYE